MPLVIPMPHPKPTATVLPKTRGKSVKELTGWYYCYYYYYCLLYTSDAADE